MKIQPERTYRVTLEETLKDGNIVIVQAILDVRARTMEDACTEVRNYFGMGIAITITKCELCG